jgi:hypothetical protein
VERFHAEDELMLRKMIMAALAIAAVGLATPQAAQARGGFGGGGHIGGGGHWGGGGGWGHGWHGGGFWPGVAIGAGIAGAGYYGAYGYGYGDPYYYGAGYDDGGYGAQCYLVQQRVMTQWGWRVRRVQVCE